MLARGPRSSPIRKRSHPSLAKAPARITRNAESSTTTAATAATRAGEKETRSRGGCHRSSSTP
eukprot:15447423-Alexandrium_andersonii.AAC.1